MVFPKVGAKAESCACADAPVMLVNDLHMCSFMTNDKLDQLIDGLTSEALKRESTA